MQLIFWSNTHHCLILILSSEISPDHFYYNCHKGATEIFWQHISGAVVLYFTVFDASNCVMNRGKINKKASPVCWMAPEHKFFYSFSHLEDQKGPFDTFCLLRMLQRGHFVILPSNKALKQVISQIFLLRRHKNRPFVSVVLLIRLQRGHFVKFCSLNGHFMKFWPLLSNICPLILHNFENPEGSARALCLFFPA